MSKKCCSALIVLSIIGTILSSSPADCGKLKWISGTISGIRDVWSCHPPLITADGQVVAFYSAPGTGSPVDNSVPTAPRLCIYDAGSGTTNRVSVDGWTDYGCLGDLSALGQYVVFSANYTPATNSWLMAEIYVWDRQTGAIECVSTKADGTLPNQSCEAGSISSDGRFVTFYTSATDIVPGVSQYISQIYLVDRLAKTIKCISADPNGIPGNKSSTWHCMSRNGRIIAFQSDATNLVPGVSSRQIYAYDMQANSLECISTPKDGSPAYLPYQKPSISRDGRYIAFTSSAVPNSNGNFPEARISIYDRQTGIIQRLGYGGQPSISGDGTHVAYTSSDYEYLADLSTGISKCISSSFQQQGYYYSSDVLAVPAISDDGSKVAFHSSSIELAEDPVDGHGSKQIYLYDDLATDDTSDTILAGRTADGHIYCTDGSSGWKGLSGRLSQVVLGDTNGDGKKDLAGLAVDGTIWQSTDKKTWKQIPGRLNSMALGDFSGTGSKGIAGVASDGSVWCSTNLSTWKNIPGRLSSIVTGNFAGKGKDGIAGIASNGTIWYSGDLSTWKQIPGHLSKIWAADIDLDSVDDLIGITSDGTIWYTTDRQNWTSIPGRLADIVVGNFAGTGPIIAGRTSDGTVWYTTDKQNWSSIPGHLETMTTAKLNGLDRIAGTSADGQIWYTKNLRDWIKIPGTLSTLHSDRF